MHSCFWSHHRPAADNEGAQTETGHDSGQRLAMNYIPPVAARTPSNTAHGPRQTRQKTRKEIA